MVFITAGEGGGTGTGGAPGRRRDRQGASARSRSASSRDRSASRASGAPPRPTRASQGLKDKVDTLIVIPNDRLLTVSTAQTSMLDAFRMADEVLLQGVRGITDLITVPGLINTDFADVRMIMNNAGSAIMGIGQSTGEGRAVNAARAAITSPLLEASIEGARGILINIVGGPELTLFEVNEAAEIVHSVAHQDANIIFGSVVDDAHGRRRARDGHRRGLRALGRRPVAAGQDLVERRARCPSRSTCSATPSSSPRSSPSTSTTRATTTSRASCGEPTRATSSSRASRASLAAVRERIAAAGRDPAAITRRRGHARPSGLTRSPPRSPSGLGDVGENYADELVAHHDAVGALPLDLALPGRAAAQQARPAGAARRRATSRSPSPRDAELRRDATPRRRAATSRWTSRGDPAGRGARRRRPPRSSPRPRTPGLVVEGLMCVASPEPAARRGRVRRRCGAAADALGLVGLLDGDVRGPRGRLRGRGDHACAWARRCSGTALRGRSAGLA